MNLRQIFISSYAVLVASGLAAHETVELSAVEVRAKAENLEGIAKAGSEGVVSSQRLSAMPILRPGEVLEMVPGLIVTQHAGDGRPTSISCAASIWITVRTLRLISVVCRLICRRTPTVKAIPI